MNNHCPAITTNNIKDLIEAFEETLSSVIEKDCPLSFAIAVSGGPDSMALLYLMKIFAQKKGALIHCVTVDHRLRKESRDEAHMVKQYCQSLNIPHTTLIWEGEKPHSRLQESARNVRYQLLEEFCLSKNFSYLLTAHHYGDQLETFFMRLLKGSGIKGLTGIEVKTGARFGHILRPLLSFSKEELMHIIQTNNLPYITDPSNENKDFERVRIRTLLHDMVHTYHISLEKIQKSISHLSETSHFLQQETLTYLKQVVAFSVYGIAKIDLETFLKLPLLVQKEIIKKVCLKIFPTPYAPQKTSLLRALSAMQQRSKRFCLQGSLFHFHQNVYWVTRDLRHAPKPAYISPKESLLFDKRISIENKNDHVAIIGYGKNLLVPKELLKTIDLPGFLKPYLIYFVDHNQAVYLINNFSLMIE